jgi:thymidylate kinase
MKTAQHRVVMPISNGYPCLVSFSGIDGAGKTTQIDAVLAWLRETGLRACLMRFWDDVVALGRIRESVSHTVFKSEKGVGSPERPVQRRDKNVRAWYMTGARMLLYFMDATRLAFVVAAASRTEADVVIFDRYLYDELANLDLGNPVVRVYARLLLKLIPRPDIAFLLDADPAQAQARKPEYPLDFLRSNRASYRTLANLAGMTVIRPLAANEVTDIVLRELSMALLRSQTENLPHSPVLPYPDHQ